MAYETIWQYGIIQGLPLNAKSHIALLHKQKFKDPQQSRSVTHLIIKESMKFLGLWLCCHLSFKKHISVLKPRARRPLMSPTWSGDETATHSSYSTETFLMFYRVFIHSKLNSECVVYTASNTNLWQLDNFNNTWLKLGLGGVLHQPIYTQNLMKLLWRNAGWNWPCIIWKPVPVSTNWYTRPCMNLTKPQ